MNKKKITIISAVLLASVAIITAVILIGRNAAGKSDKENTSAGTSAQEEAKTYISADLYVSDLFKYSGKYVEDRSDEEVEDIAAIRLTNGGDKDYEYIEFNVKTADDEYSFKASGILAGESVLVLSADKKEINGDGAVTSGECTVLSEYTFKPTMLGDMFEVYQSAPSVTIKNISGRELKGKICIYYKNTGADGLLGGITYRFSIDSLGKDEMQQRTSEHLGKVLFITYDE